jgi:DNA-binding transcriptional LysR family regulator
VELTEIGAVLVEQARDILSLQRQFVASAAGLARGERGHLRFGIAGAVALVPLIPIAIRRFRETWPKLRSRSRKATRPTCAGPFWTARWT